MSESANSESWGWVEWTATLGLAAIVFPLTYREIARAQPPEIVGAYNADVDWDGIQDTVLEHRNGEVEVYLSSERSRGFQSIDDMMDRSHRSYQDR